MCNSSGLFTVTLRLNLLFHIDSRTTYNQFSWQQLTKLISKVVLLPKLNQTAILQLKTEARKSFCQQRILAETSKGQLLLTPVFFTSFCDLIPSFTIQSSWPDSEFWTLSCYTCTCIIGSQWKKWAHRAARLAGMCWVSQCHRPKHTAHHTPTATLELIPVSETLLPLLADVHV